MAETYNATIVGKGDPAQAGRVLRDVVWHKRLGLKFDNREIFPDHLPDSVNPDEAFWTYEQRRPNPDRLEIHVFQEACPVGLRMGELGGKKVCYQSAEIGDALLVWHDHTVFESYQGLGKTPEPPVYKEYTPVMVDPPTEDLCKYEEIGGGSER